MRVNGLPAKAVLVLSFVGAFIACGTGPLEPTSEGEERQLRVDGPAAVTPGGTAQFSATVLDHSGLGRDVTAEVEWTSLNEQTAVVSESGFVTGKATGHASIRARFRGLSFLGLKVLEQTKELLVRPDGTVLVAGYILDSGTPTPVCDARVEVVGGGETLRTRTDPWECNYVLYGVPRDAEIEVTSPGFRPARQSVESAVKTTAEAWSLNFTLHR